MKRGFIRQLFFDHPQLGFGLNCFFIGTSSGAAIINSLMGGWWGYPLLAFNLWMLYGRLHLEERMIATAVEMVGQSAYAKGKADGLREAGGSDGGASVGASAN